MTWEIYVAIALTALLLFAGGYIRNLVKQTKELFDVISCALEDSEITPEELSVIMKEAKDVKTAIIDIIATISKAR